MWYEWNTLAEFDLWHNALCLELGYPETAVNQATRLPDENAQKTVAYTKVFEVDGKWIASVEAEYADGLTLTNLRLPIEKSRFDDKTLA
jgi:hypothetical protein